jgi:hypothetical protein
MKASRSNLWLACCEDLSAGKQAEAIFDQMLEFHKAGGLDVNPITITFHSVFSSWPNSHDPSQQQEGKPKQSWASSHDPLAGKQAKAILD